MNQTIPGYRDKPLFTPGPLSTSYTIKQAMLRDLGSRDFEFITIVKDIRNKLLSLAGINQGEYEAVLMQGSGTFGLESVVSSTIPRDRKFLVIANGAYGKRIAKMARIHHIDTQVLEYAENELPHLDTINDVLQADQTITNVCVVHCETTTGLINPIEAIGEIVKESQADYFVDAMSSFGAVPIDFQRSGIDYLVSSSNKCIEGVPGFSFIIAKKDRLLSIEGYARSLSLDLLEQWKGLEANGQFRFTPPTHAILAFYQALQELEWEGGIEGRAARYRTNYECVVEGMRDLGFKEYLPSDLQGYIITSFLYPEHPRFSFESFYEKLNHKGYVIYPGKVSNADCFRIGNIGRLFQSDMKALLAAIQETLSEMNVVIA